MCDHHSTFRCVSIIITLILSSSDPPWVFVRAQASMGFLRVAQASHWFLRESREICIAAISTKTWKQQQLLLLHMVMSLEFVFSIRQLSFLRERD